MTTAWITRTIVAALLITMAATLIDQIAGLLTRPRRWIWGAAMIASIALPLMTLQWTFGHPLLAIVDQFYPTAPTLFQQTLSSHILSSLSTHGAVSRTPFEMWSVILVWAWVSASVLGVTSLMVVQGWLYSRSETWPKTHLEGIDVFVTPHFGPAVVGVRRPSVLLPAWVFMLPASMRRIIVRHEEEHLRAGDSRLLVGAAVLLAIMPWNLALWFQWYRLRAAIETDCDARVLATGMDVREYGEVLLRVAARSVAVPFLNPALGTRGALLKRRILVMTRQPTGHVHTKLVALATAALLVGVAAVDASSLRAPLPVVVSAPKGGYVQKILPKAPPTNVHRLRLVVAPPTPVQHQKVGRHIQNQVKSLDTVHVVATRPPDTQTGQITISGGQVTMQFVPTTFTASIVAQ